MRRPLSMGLIVERPALIILRVWPRKGSIAAILCLLYRHIPHYYSRDDQNINFKHERIQTLQIYFILHFKMPK